jgi:transketolase
VQRPRKQHRRLTRNADVPEAVRPVARDFDLDGRVVPHGPRRLVVEARQQKPLDERLLAESFDRLSVVAVVDEHSVIGGLGSAVAEWLGRSGPRRGVLEAIGTPDAFISEAGSQQWMRGRCGLTAAAIAERIARRSKAVR